MNKIIALSAGHSDSDPGAVKDGLVERDIVEKIVAMATPIIRNHGVGVLNPPSSLSLTQTIAWINARKDQVDLCSEIHINAGGGLGLEGWYYRGSEMSKKFAQFLVDAINAESGMSKDRGVKDERYAKWGRLGFVHDTIPLACLIECGFIDREEDRKILSTDTGLYNIAKGVARGVVSYLGIPWNPNPEPENTCAKELEETKVLLAECQNNCSRLTDRLKQISELSKL